jgi:hypothetical protein
MGRLLGKKDHQERWDMKREIVSEEKLLLILNDMLLAHADCAGCRIDQLNRHQPDETGCNWSPGDLLCSGDVSPCLPVMGLLVAGAREKYNLK